MDNKQKHLCVDYICVTIMLIGLVIFNLSFFGLKSGAAIGFPIGLCGIVGIYLNEKLNPYEGE